MSIGCTTWVNYEWVNGQLVAATCKCGTRQSF
jgi:hypothetical protein